LLLRQHKVEGAVFDVERAHEAARLDDFKDQLLIAFLRRLGNKVTIPVQEVDETGRFVCAFNIENGAFNFVLTEKQ
jgi:hypothetical protein